MDMPKAELLEALAALGEPAVGGRPLEELRKQYHDALNPHLGERRRLYEALDRAVQLPTREH